MIFEGDERVTDIQTRCLVTWDRLQLPKAEAWRCWIDFQGRNARKVTKRFLRLELRNSDDRDATVRL